MSGITCVGHPRGSKTKSVLEAFSAARLHSSYTKNVSVIHVHEATSQYRYYDGLEKHVTALFTKATTKTLFLLVLDEEDCFVE